MSYIRHKHKQVLFFIATIGVIYVTLYIVHNLGSWPITSTISNINTNSITNTTSLNTNRTTEEDKWCHDIFASYNIDKYGMEIEGNKFASQFGQDWFIYSTMFQEMQKLQKNGVYIDLAANNFKVRSNTYFLDKCLSWKGICIEPQWIFHAGIQNHRSCQLIDNCIWLEAKKMIFEYARGDKGFSGLKGFNKIEASNRKIKRKQTIQCVTLQSIFDENNIKNVDYLSLDIEGAELEALQGIDFNKTQIDVISIEANNNASMQYLENNGFMLKARLFEDIVYVHSKAYNKLKWIDTWIKSVSLLLELNNSHSFYLSEGIINIQ